MVLCGLFNRFVSVLILIRLTYNIPFKWMFNFNHQPPKKLIFRSPKVFFVVDLFYVNYSCTKKEHTRLYSITGHILLKVFKHLQNKQQHQSRKFFKFVIGISLTK